MADPRVIVGLNPADDSAVYRLENGTLLVQTLDFFTPILDDPYWFGAVSAANALSDIYAMGARPLFALNVVCFPSRKLPIDVLSEILRGGAEKAVEAGIPIVGGHSVDDGEPKYGLVVTGVVEEGRLITSAGSKPGDVLILTKPLGTGILSTALKAGELPNNYLEEMTRKMAELNRSASEAMVTVGANACTDVTGFGLLGHLCEMLRASKMSARISADSVPLLPGVREMLRKGMVPGGTHRNLKYYGQWVDWSEFVDEETRLILCDAQTSGGLLISIARGRKDSLIAELEARGVHTIAEVGEVIEGVEGRVFVEK